MPGFHNKNPPLVLGSCHLFWHTWYHFVWLAQQNSVLGVKLTSVRLSWLESRGKNLQHSSNGGLVPQSSLSIGTEHYVSWKHFLSWHTGALLQGCTDNVEQKTGSHMDPTRSWLLSCHRYRLLSRSSLFELKVIITGVLSLSWINIEQSN